MKNPLPRFEYIFKHHTCTFGRAHLKPKTKYKTHDTKHHLLAYFQL